MAGRLTLKEEAKKHLSHYMLGVIEGWYDREEIVSYLNEMPPLTDKQVLDIMHRMRDERIGEEAAVQAKEKLEGTEFQYDSDDSMDYMGDKKEDAHDKRRKIREQLESEWDETKYPTPSYSDLEEKTSKGSSFPVSGGTMDRLTTYGLFLLYLMDVLMDVYVAVFIFFFEPCPRKTLLSWAYCIVNAYVTLKISVLLVRIYITRPPPFSFDIQNAYTMLALKTLMNMFFLTSTCE